MYNTKKDELEMLGLFCIEFQGDRLEIITNDMKSVSSKNHSNIKKKKKILKKRLQLKSRIIVIEKTN